MTTFDERERSMETAFVLDNETKFRITSRRRKLLGLWAAERIGLGDEESLKYAVEIVTFGIDDKSSGAVVNKILADAKTNKITLSENEVRNKNAEFEVIATKQILEEKK